MEGLKSFEETASEEEYNQYLTFALGKEFYGMAVKNIREVIEYSQIAYITHIPMVPDYIKGVINLRGEVVPVIDLSSRFYGHKSNITRRTCIIIIEIENNNDMFLLGAMIDAVNSVVDIPSNDIDPTPEFGARIRSNFISGIGKASDKFIILLNINNVLDIDELSSFEKLDDGSDALLLSKVNNYS